MQVHTFEDLIDWTRALHERLAQCLAQCSTKHEEQRAKWLLSYLSEHEGKLRDAIDGFEKGADPKALKTMIYDYLDHPPIAPHRLCDAPYAQMDFEQICESVFGLHNQAISLYRNLLARAPIPEANELVQPLLDLEQHETMLMAQQANRMRDL